MRLDLVDLRQFRSRAVLQIEILALRLQFGVLQRSVKRPRVPQQIGLSAWPSQVWADAISHRHCEG